MPAPPGPVIVTRRVPALEEVLDPRKSVGPADEAVMERGEARRRERLERRKVVAEAGRDELEELSRGRDVLQAMVPERSKRRAGNGSAPAMSRVARVTTICSPCADRAHPGRDDDVHADVPLVAELGLARVNADPETVRLVRGPRLGRERALDLGGGGIASRARANARKTPSPAQSTSAPSCCAAAARTSSRMRARAGANRSPRRCSSRVEPSTSAKSNVTVPAGKRRCELSVAFTRRV